MAVIVPITLPSRILAAKPQPAQALGLYVHIPFCVRKCYYCDFNSGPASEEIRKQDVDALTAEIRSSPWRGQQAQTIFFGGGTPSELKTQQLRRIVQALRGTFPLTPAPEWTIECNPGTVDQPALDAMVEMGFNRISLGVQSFQDHHLKAVGRIHTAAEAVEAVRRARRAGFRRLNLDLIFCLPGQTLAEWQYDVERALELQPEHVSLYNLTIEDATEFGRRHRLGLLSLPDEDLSADMYEWVIERAARSGFAQDQVSNFGLPGEECRHNQIYWRQEPFVGFGVSAASYWEGARWSNTGSMSRYLATAGREDGPERESEERLPPRQACGEGIMLGLRTREGADVETLAARYGLDGSGGRTALRRLAQDGLMVRDGRHWKLTPRGVMLANAVCGEFL